MTTFSDSSWICHPGAAAQRPHSMVFRLDLELAEPTRTTVHVSADQRYQLFVNGTRIGLGPERGDRSRWFFESYPLELDAGAHQLTALVWYLPEDQMPGAQISSHPGFLLAADPEHSLAFSTGIAPWRVCELGGIDLAHASHAVFCGPRYLIDGAEFDYRIVTGELDEAAWIAPVAAGNPVLAAAPSNRYGIVGERLLAPAMLPHAMDRPFRALRCRWASVAQPEAPLLIDPLLEIDPQRNDPRLVELANALVAGATPLVVPPASEYVALIELDTYYCAYPELSTSGGSGSRVELGWAESLYESTRGVSATGPQKGNRDEIDGKLFYGDFDSFLPAGRDEERFSTPWWRSGRYLLLRIHTSSESLTITNLSFRETRQPVELAASFTASDPRLEAFTPIGFRSLQMCAHETLVDCPYYEQLQYVGDSRLDALVLYAAASNDALARKCILQFDESRLVSGITRASYPNHETQVIPGFSLRWISMVHDFARYRDDPEFVRDRLSGCRAVLDWYARRVNGHGTVGRLPYWNFVDWATDWENGVPPAGSDGSSCVNSLEYADALSQAAALETWAGEPALARLYSERCDSVLASVVSAYWDEGRGMLADTVEKDRFSEHVQALALTLGVGDARSRERMLDALLTAPDLSRCTIYYSWYLFEALFACDRPDAVLERMPHWFAHRDLGLVTCAETPEPSRSDCHAWGAHPIWHYFASFAGIRPADWGFRRVRIRPALGPLDSLRAATPHPAGTITVECTRTGSGLRCTVNLPEGPSGELEWNGSRVELESGTRTYELPG